MSRNFRAVRHHHRQKRAIFDLDSIIVNLMEPWLAWYNHEYKDNLTFDQVTTYKIESHVKPECGTKIFDFFSPPERYGEIPIYEGAAEVLRRLHDNDVDIVIATATAGSTAPQKYVLAKKAAPWLDRHNIFIGTRKEVLHGHFFIDDAPKNMDAYMAEWPDAHVLTIGHPYNQDHRHKVKLFAEDCFNTKQAWAKIVDYILSTDVEWPEDAETVSRLTKEVEMWKSRAASHGCDTENGDDDCG